MTDKWELTPSEALIHLIRWTHSVDVMRLRILDPNAGPLTFKGDLHLFSLAIREALRFAELTRAVSARTAWSAIDKATHTFEVTCPHVKDVRNVLDHFDDYLRGRGKDFNAGRPSEHAGEFFQVLRPAGWFCERRPASVVLHVSPKPGTVLTLDIAESAAALRELTRAIQAAVADLG